ncbi:hypothetical protein D3C80_1972260 [compost metagenome]
MVIRVDARYRLPALVREEVMVHMPVPVLLAEQQLQLVKSKLRIKGHNCQYILGRIPVAYPAERAGRVEGNIA